MKKCAGAKARSSRAKSRDALAHRIQVLALIGRLRPSTSLGMNGVGSLYFIGLPEGEREKRAG